MVPRAGCDFVRSVPASVLRLVWCFTERNLFSLQAVGLLPSSPSPLSGRQVRKQLLHGRELGRGRASSLCAGRQVLGREFNPASAGEICWSQQAALLAVVVWYLDVSASHRAWVATSPRSGRRAVLLCPCAETCEVPPWLGEMVAVEGSAVVILARLPPRLQRVGPLLGREPNLPATLWVTGVLQPGQARGTCRTPFEARNFVSLSANPTCDRSQAPPGSVSPPTRVPGARKGSAMQEGPCRWHLLARAAKPVCACDRCLRYACEQLHKQRRRGAAARRQC